MVDKKTATEPGAQTNTLEKQTPLGKFVFSYPDSPLYLNSPVCKETERLDLPNLFTTEVAKVAKDLDITGPLKIIVEIPNPIEDYVIPELGIGARIKSDKKVLSQFDPSHKQIVENLVKWQGRIIAHELNHIARWNFSGITLLDALIFEGLAVNYEEHWGGKYQKSPWGNTLKAKQLKIEWRKAQKELGSTEYSHDDWFFGTYHGHPRWTGYALGTAIVKSYLDRHPKEPMREVLKKDSLEILEQSKFTQTVTMS